MCYESTCSFWRIRKLSFLDENEERQILNNILQLPDNNESDIIIEFDFKYPAEIKHKTEIVLFLFKRNQTLIFHD